MDKLFLMRLSDRPSEVMEVCRPKFNDRMFLFSVKERQYCLTIGASNICWLAELAKYDKPTATNFTASHYASPGGYDRARLKLIWRNELRQALLEFVNTLDN
jgi:hypothetical protein